MNISNCRGSARNRTSLILLLVGAAGSCPAASQAAVVAASNFQSGFVASGIRTDVGYRRDEFLNTAHSQRFVAELGGRLLSLTAMINRNSATTPLVVSIYADNGSQKPGALLGRREFGGNVFPTSYFPPSGPTVLDMSTLAIQLAAGVQYHAVFTTATAIPGGIQYSAHLMYPHAGSFGLPYLHSRDGGATWNNGSGSGAEAPLTVTVVPEPASYSVLIATLLLMQRRRGLARREIGSSLEDA
jgi:hypothetical protein